MVKTYSFLREGAIRQACCANENKDSPGMYLSDHNPGRKRSEEEEWKEEQEEEQEEEEEEWKEEEEGQW